MTGGTNIEHELDKLFVGNVKLIIFTKGKDGAEAYTKFAKASIPGIKTQVEDTTGAGDGFIGSFLYALKALNVTAENISDIDNTQLERCIAFSNKFCGESVKHQGAINSYRKIEFI